jgi:hypothetical protein
VNTAYVTELLIYLFNDPAIVLCNGRVVIISVQGGIDGEFCSGNLLEDSRKTEKRYEGF